MNAMILLFMSFFVSSLGGFIDFEDRNVVDTKASPTTTFISSHADHKSSSATTTFSKITAAPSGVNVISDAPLTLPTDKLETTCSRAIPLQTSFWMKTPQVNLAGSRWFEGKTTNWTFSTNTPGVVLGIPSVPSAQDSESGASHIKFVVKNRKTPNSFDLTIGPLVNEKVMFGVYNDNGSRIQEDTWKLPPGKRQSDITDLGNLGLEEVLFELNVQGYGVCDFPVTNATCREGDIELLPDTWKAHRVDQFLDKWIKSKNKHFPNGFLEAFKSDFGIHTDVCNVQKSCQSLQKCSNQGDPDGPDAIAVFLAYEAMVHLANYFNMLYSSILTASNFASNRVATLVQDFFPSPESKFDSDPHVSPVHEASMALGLASFFMFFIPTAGIALGSAAGIISGILGEVEAHKQRQQPPQDHTPTPFSDATKLQDDLNTIITNYQSTIESWQTSTLEMGTNITLLLHGGAMVNPHTVEFNTTSTSRAAAWFQEYITIKLINHAWWLQNVFITFMPYGKVTKLDSIDGKQDFDESQCASNFLEKDDFINHLSTNQPVLCNTDSFFVNFSDFRWGPGMARLTWYDKDPKKQGPGLCKPDGPVKGQDTHMTVRIDDYPHGWNQNPAPAWDMVNWNYTFSVQDVIASSLKSWIKGGYNFDLGQAITNETSGAPTDAEALMALDGFHSAKPGDAGMFNLPVVVVENLNNWPKFAKKSGYGGVWDTNQDRDGKKITDAGILAPDLHDFITRYDGQQPFVKNDKCK